MEYQVTKYLPWFFRRYFLVDRDVERPPLYNEYMWKKQTNGDRAGHRPGGVIDESTFTIHTDPPDPDSDHD